LKKILGSGTGEKSRRQEVEEARQALTRWLEIDAEFENVWPVARRRD
jgi:hypothetical protein